MRKILASFLLLLSSAASANTMLHRTWLQLDSPQTILLEEISESYWPMEKFLTQGSAWCASVVGGTPMSYGSNTLSSGNTYTYIYGSGGQCRQYTMTNPINTINWTSYTNFPYSGAGTSPAYSVQGAWVTAAECSNHNAVQVPGYNNCECAPGDVLNEVTGMCEEDNQCDTNAIPNTSSFEVNIYTSTAPSSICVDNCNLNVGSGFGLPHQNFYTYFYKSDGQSCTGGFSPDASDFVQGDPDGPICKTSGGSEYCYDPVNNTVTKDGVLAWDFDNGDYYDGHCAIRSGGVFTCGPNSTVPGTDNSDPEITFAVDTDDDGIADFYFVADSASGLARIAPGTRIDTTGDGQADSVAVDTDNDGISDTIKGDSNNDGQPDHDDPSTPNTDESAPPGDTNAGGSGGGNNSGGNDTGTCVDNPNTPWNECDTDGDGEGGDPGDGSCQDDPNTPWNDCSIGADLDGCNKQPEVSGDPLQAAAIFLAWQSACSGYVTPEQRGNGLDLADNRPEDDGSFLSTAVDLPSSLDQSGFLGSGSGLPDYSLSILGESYDIEVSKWEPFLQTAGALLVVMSLLWAGRLLVEV